MLKLLVKVLCVLVLMAACAAGWGVWEAKRFLETSPARPGQDVYFDVAPGATLARIARQLEEKGIVADEFKFRLLARWKKQSSKLQAGRFLLSTGWTPEKVLDSLVNGKPAFTRVTIPEGLAWWQTAALIEESGLARASDFAEVIRDPEFLRHYGIPFETAEGFLMPDTYLLKTLLEGQPLDRAQARAVAGRMVDNFWRKAQEVWPSGKPSRDELKTAVILASIVEKETAIAAERPRVAGVYANRLAKGMLLQADPTVIYGLGQSFNGNLTKANLQDPRNLYNTYKLPGLPPTPICSFGVSALKAAVNPEKHEFLYFVAVTDGGSHAFSKTLQEHNQAVRRYLQNRKK